MKSSTIWRCVMLLAVVFAIASGLKIRKQILSASYTHEIIIPDSLTEPLGGEKVLEYEFSAQHRTLSGLWVFFSIPPKARSEGRLTLTMRRAGDDRPFWSQSFDCKQSQLVGEAQLCVVQGLRLQKRARYVLTYAMPDMNAVDGWALRYCRMDNLASTVRWDSQVQRSAEPGLVWLEERPRFPLAYILVCASLLAVCSIAAGNDTCYKWPALLTLVCGCIHLAAYHWQLNLWEFWGNFWPDGYVGLSYKLSSVLAGRISFKECLAYYDHHRCGQAFLAPVVMAAFQVLGLSIKGSFMAANGVFLAAASALLLGLLRLNGVTGDRPTISACLLFFSHRCIIGAVGELQTDLAGVAATLFFMYALLRALATEESKARLGWYLLSGMAAFLACTVRIALLSLPLIPACLFVWSLFCERQRPWRERIEYLIPTFTGVGLLWACWRSLGLWGTLNLDWEVANQYAQLFSWKGFLISTFQGVQLGLLVIIVLWRRLFHDRAFAAVVGSAFSLLALLVCTPGPPWLRYWDPMAALGVVMFIWILKIWPTRDRPLLMVTWLNGNEQNAPSVILDRDGALLIVAWISALLNLGLA